MKDTDAKTTEENWVREARVGTRVAATHHSLRPTATFPVKPCGLKHSSLLKAEATVSPFPEPLQMKCLKAIL